MAEPEWAAEARELRELGFNFSTVAKRVGQPYNHVYYFLNRERMREQQDRTVTLECPDCGAEFERRASAIGEGKCRSCSSNRKRKQIERICRHCGKHFSVRESTVRRGWARYCSRTCYFAGRDPQAGNDARRKKNQDRRGPKNPNYRHGKRSGVRDREGERRWYATMRSVCAAPDCASRQLLAQHHIVYRQTVRREHGDEWDPRNGMTLCASCHSSHHHRGRVLPLTCLPDSAYEFADELLGAGAAYEYLRRRYAGDDPRLERLLDHEPLMGEIA